MLILELVMMMRSLMMMVLLVLLLLLLLLLKPKGAAGGVKDVANLAVMAGSGRRSPERSQFMAGARDGPD